MIQEDILVSSDIQDSNSSNKLLLLCDGQGKIVFISGKCQIFRMKQTQILQRNFFNLGFTIRSLLLLQRCGLSHHDYQECIGFLQMINRQNVWSYKASKWKKTKENLLIKLGVRISYIRAVFKKGQICKRETKISKRDRLSDSKDNYYLIQIVQVIGMRIRCYKSDYEYIRRNYINDIHQTNTNL